MNRDHVHIDLTGRGEPDEPAPVRREPPKVPSWVVDLAKWGSLSRAQRRALIRHHAKQARRG